jgi:hypothetical protein
MSEFDDLSVGLARASSKPWFSKTSLVLAALVLLTAGFLVGLQVAPTSSTAAAPSGFNRGNFPGGAEGFPGGFTGQGRTGTGNSNGNGASTREATTGKIKLVDGKTVYVELADGTLVTVKLTDTTKVLSTATAKDLQAGTSVSVQGQTGSDGTITAGTITQTK